MSMYSTNIYKAARKRAGLTQEKAAASMGVSVESLKAYERYDRLPPMEVVDWMCTVYEADYLAIQHHRVSSGAVQVVPEVQVLDLPLAAMRIVNRVQAFAAAHRDKQLMDIADDGVIDEAERPLFDEIIAELEELVKAAYELKYAESKGKEVQV